MTYPPYINEIDLTHCIQRMLCEDIGMGDFSSLGIVSSDIMGKARLIIKEAGMVAGVVMAEKICFQQDKELSIVVHKKDGEEVASGDTVLIMEGLFQSMLSVERVILNCMQRMSGIATYTNYLCGLLEGTGVRLKDTRKTTPNFRMMEKWAVTLGGGLNHRMGLYDMIMIKDNHIDVAGGIKEAIRRMNSYLKENKKKLVIEIEVRNLNELDDVLEEGDIDIIMLDNMSVEDMKKAVRTIDNRFLVEASGSITETTLREVAACGVDYISVGALTHSVSSLDMSFKVIK